MKKIIALFGVATLALMAAAVFMPNISHADDDCVLGASDFAAIQAIENNPNLTYSQELTQELALRKQLLGETITCAQSDAQTLQAALNSVPTTTQDTTGAEIRSQLAGKINDTVNFYNIESAKLDGAGISATEAIAKEMIAWRTTNYVPLVGAVNNFALWSENQALFETAQNRLTQTERLVAFIQDAAPVGNLSGSLQAAQASFQDADNANNAAATALEQIQPSDESLTLIQQSLQSLADAYQKFTDLNNVIQTLLPTQQQ